MKIAIPSKANNMIDDHFGHCEFYTIFSISENHQVANETTLPSPQGCGCKSDIAFTLAQMDVTIMLAGGIGNGAINKLSQQNIQVIRNCKGDIHNLIDAYLSGHLKDGGSSCSAHENHSDHTCNHA